MKILVISLFLAIICWTFAAYCDLPYDYLRIPQVMDCLNRIPVNPNALHDLQVVETVASLYVYRDVMTNTDSRKCNSDTFYSANFGIKVDIMKELHNIRSNLEQGNYKNDFQFYSDIFYAFRKLKDAHTMFRFAPGYQFFMLQTFSISVINKNGAPAFIMQDQNGLMQFNTPQSLLPYKGMEIKKINGITVHEYLDLVAKHYCSLSMDHSTCFNFVIKSDFPTKLFIEPKGVAVNGIDEKLIVEIELEDGTRKIVESNPLIRPVAARKGDPEDYYSNYVEKKTLNQNSKPTSFLNKNSNFIEEYEELIGSVMTPQQKFTKSSIFEKQLIIENLIGKKMNFPISQEFFNKIEKIDIFSANSNSLQEIKKIVEVEENDFKTPKKTSNGPLNAPKQGLFRVDEWVEGGKIMAQAFALTLDDQPTGVGLLNLPTFVQDPSYSPQIFAKMINKMVDVGAKRIIVDTRGNGGGYIDSGYGLAKKLAGSLPEYPNLWPACDFLVPPTPELNGDDFSADEYDEFSKRTTSYLMCKENLLINSTVPCSGYGELENPTKLADNIYFSDLKKGPIREINGKKTMYSKPFSLADEFNPERMDTKIALTPSDVIILSGGECGSTCGMFLTILQYTLKAKVVTIGGSFEKSFISKAKSKQGVASFKGASVFNIEELKNINENYLGTGFCKNCPKSEEISLKSNGIMTFSRLQMYPHTQQNLFDRKSFDANCPLEFTWKPADFHIWKWDVLKQDISIFFETANFFDSCASWEHRPIPFEVGKCGDKSTFVENAVYGEICGSNGKYRTGTCERFSCLFGYHYDENKNACVKKFEWVSVADDPYKQYMKKPEDKPGNNDDGGFRIPFIMLFMTIPIGLLMNFVVILMICSGIGFGVVGGFLGAKFEIDKKILKIMHKHEGFADLDKENAQKP